MRAVALLLSVLASLCVYVVAADTENYQVFMAAAGSMKIAKNRRYSVYEYWHSTGGFPDCITGWSHIRVIYGKVESRSGQNDFVGTAFDMVTVGNNKVELNIEPWVANHYEKDHQFVRVSQDSVYTGVHLVKSGMTDNAIREIGTSCFDQLSRTFVLNLDHR